MTIAPAENNQDLRTDQRQPGQPVHAGGGSSIPGRTTKPPAGRCRRRTELDRPCRYSSGSTSATRDDLRAHAGSRCLTPPYFIVDLGDSGSMHRRVNPRPTLARRLARHGRRRWALLFRCGATMQRPPKRSGRITCDGLRSCATPHGRPVSSGPSRQADRQRAQPNFAGAYSLFR
jgi:hypothetical protein